ncbi:hypothetical protein M569_01890, partial [Genlisea aurea]
GVRELDDYRSKCRYVKTHRACSSKGYLNYLVIFYCTFQGVPVLGYSVLFLWFMILFYVLADTTSEYFCPSVTQISRNLKLSPTIAGTTLLPLGNGAPDVFSSIISFTRSGDEDVGLNSILGGAFFVCCCVVGILCISVSSHQIKIEQASFMRDILFFLFVLCCLLVIILIGKINLWFSLCFVSLYIVYIGLVSVMHLYYKDERVINAPIPILSADELLETPLIDEEKGINFVPVTDEFRWTKLIVSVLQLPLSLPRKLTIPVVTEDKWSKAFAVASSTLAPILLATLYTTQCQETEDFRVIINACSFLCGVVLGGLSLFLTDSSSPPRQLAFLWLTGGFVMSVTWTYIIVEEVVSLVVSLGDIMGISPSILGFTALAWGNSLGDLISNLGMGLKGGEDGAQVAVSGCYAGPLFNTLVGLGLSLVLASWREYPEGLAVAGESDVFETVGFLMGGLVWAVVMVPKREMKLDKFVGVGLLGIYLCFLSLRLVKSMGLL